MSRLFFKFYVLILLFIIGMDKPPTVAGKLPDRHEKRIVMGWILLHHAPSIRLFHSGIAPASHAQRNIHRSHPKS